MTRVLLAALFACGCSDPADYFIGTWQYDQTSMVHTQCTSGTTTAPLVGSVTYTPTIGGNIVPDQQSVLSLLDAQSGSCTVLLHAADTDTGEVASIGLGPTCDLVTIAGDMSVEFYWYRAQHVSAGVGLFIETTATPSGSTQPTCYMMVNATLVR
jgi:hypothetical protein